MTQTYYTKKILNIEDENVYFYENCLEIQEIKGIKTKIFTVILHIHPKFALNVDVLITVLKILSKGILNEIVKLKLLKFVIIISYFF